MRIPNYGIPPESQGIDDGLSEEWCTDMSNMRWFSDIHTDIVHYHGLLFEWMNYVSLYGIKEICPECICQKKVHVSTNC